MSHVTITNLERRLARLEDQAARKTRDQAPIEITCCWGNEDQGKKLPGVTYIVTDWSTTGAIERNDS